MRDRDDDDRPRRRDDDDRRSRRDRDDDRPRRRRDEDDDYDEPRRRDAAPSNGMATAALLLGIASVFFSCLAGIPAIICGFLGLAKAKASGVGKGAALVGLILGVLGTVGGPLLGYLVIGPKLEESRARSVGSNNLKQLGLGMHSYHDSTGYLPGPEAREGQTNNFDNGFNPRPGGPFGPPGGPGGPPGGDPFAPNDDPFERPPERKPIERPASESAVGESLSWRVSLLPYIEQDNLARTVKYGEPWNSPANKPLADVVVVQYRDADTKTDPNTRYRVFVGPGTMFETKKKINLVSITDGTSNTIMIAEAGDKVPWPQTNELPFTPTGPIAPLGRASSDRFQVVMGDGSVRTFRKTMSQTTLRAMITRNGGEVVDTYSER